jgi:hypothetical protein
VRFCDGLMNTRLTAPGDCRNLSLSGGTGSNRRKSRLGRRRRGRLGLFVGVRDRPRAAAATHSGAHGPGIEGRPVHQPRVADRRCGRVAVRISVRSRRPGCPVRDGCRTQRHIRGCGALSRGRFGHHLADRDAVEQGRRRGSVRLGGPAKDAQQSDRASPAPDVSSAAASVSAHGLQAGSDQDERREERGERRQGCVLRQRPA